jgi:hypothetical protein
MAQNFLTCDRDQDLLLPPSLEDWLPDDHLAWFVLEAVPQLAQAEVRARRRRGRARVAAAL